MTEAITDMNVKPEDRDTVEKISRKAAGSKPGRKAKKIRSAATLRARVVLKDRIRAEIDSRSDLTISSFADQQGVRRQYMYKILGEDENVASLDTLMGFAEDLDIKLSINVD